MSLLEKSEVEVDRPERWMFSEEISSLTHGTGKVKRPLRWILSQIAAATAQNLTLLDLGMAISFSTILIPALLGAEGELSFTKEQASWFGAFNFVLQPFGSVLSGPICEKLGRKKSLLIANLPHLAAWIMIYFAQNVETLFCANAILGLGTGFMEAPIITYIGEISHSSVRGFMTAYAEVFAVFGIFLAYLLGYLMPWRLAAITCLIFPLATIAVAISIPESPVWLLTKDRKEEAFKALCWVRGWAETPEVQKEFEELQIYQKISSQCGHCNKETLATTDCPHEKMGWFKKTSLNLKDLSRKEIMRPLSLALLMFLIQQTTGITAIRPNMVNVYNSYGMGLDGHVATVITGLLGIIGTIAMMLVVKKLGKRFLNLTSLVAATVCSFLLGTYAFVVIPHEVSSYEPESFAELQGTSSWLPITLFVLLNLGVSIGIAIMPWMMLSEIFPLRGRGTACGIAAAFCYIMNSIVSKLYFDIEKALGLYGSMWLFSGCSFLGLISMYYLMPETEGKPFEEIEREFSGKHIPIFANDCISRKIFKDRCLDAKVSKEVKFNNISGNISSIEKQVYRKNDVNENSKL